VSRYQHGASVRTGNTQFRFRARGFSFNSTSSYEWLVITSHTARYKGEGTVNGTRRYGFMLTAADSAIAGGDQDTFRLHLWDLSSDQTVYDNGTQQPLGGGNVRIQSQ
jgi:hypothetical protein